MKIHHLVLEFGYVPNSPYYKRAVEISKHMSGYRVEDDKNGKKHLTPFDESRPEEWLELYDLVRNWKTTKLHYGDKVAPPLQRTTYILACYVRRCEVEDKYSYCNFENWIGCQRVFEGKRLSINSGEFDGTQIYRPDKTKISNSVSKASSEMYSICPVFDLEKALTQINELPDEIIINENPNWNAVLKTDHLTGKTRMTGVSFVSEEGRKLGPIIEDVDSIGDFEYENGFHLHQNQSFWEHKIVTIKNTEWSSQMKNGQITKISNLGKKGWRLVSTMDIDEYIHCVFQREIVI